MAETFDFISTSDKPALIAFSTPEWLEAWAAELDETGDVTLEDYARLHNLTLDAEPSRHEFPEDAPFTAPTQQG